MLHWHKIKIYCVWLVLVFLVVAECKKKKKPQKQPWDTSLFNFLRLFVLRLIYGFASMFGAEEGISDFMDGILVPPAVENSDIDAGDDIDY